MESTIGKTVEQIRDSLREYIEATYHISAHELVQQRRELLEKTGVIFQEPFIESTPRYSVGPNLVESGLPDAVVEVMTPVSAPDGDLRALIHDPLYEHQTNALQETLLSSKSLMVTTGTGSGKTECFLLPILGKLSIEAKNKPDVFRQTPAVRSLVLYPMNALVNDQLGRMRFLYGDPRVSDQFTKWSGRPVRFARYTSRTLYPGLRSSRKDPIKLRPIEEFYLKHLPNGQEDDATTSQLYRELKERGKWPAKPDLRAWWGEKGAQWKNRCLTLPGDSELITRHEVQESAPDILITNYSMLEYMMMRPLEREIFDQTSKWLKENPTEKFLLVVDEAHLYRGAAGAEVSYLIRRLRDRLGVSAKRFQVICTSASFSDAEKAVQFGAQLTGKPESDFVAIEGKLDKRKESQTGSSSDISLLSEIDLGSFYNAATDNQRYQSIKKFLTYRNVACTGNLSRDLYDALVEYPPMGLLVNTTMGVAYSPNDLAAAIFPGTDTELGEQAVSVLIALGSLARQGLDEPSLLPCRVHSFFRGLAGLWACMDKDCTSLSGESPGTVCGRIYSQPVERCECGSKVFELYTCRNCGTAYARVYVDDLREPRYLWSEAGTAIQVGGRTIEELKHLDLLLEDQEENSDIQYHELDLVTGQLNPENPSDRYRMVYTRALELATPDDQLTGEFKPCAVCNQSASFNRSSVQDHQTKGDQPFQALIARQLQAQPPNAQVPESKFAPLRGRKVLVFSDSRQTAARLAPTLQNDSKKDVLRPILVYGFKRLYELYEHDGRRVSFDLLYLAVAIACEELGIRLRPELKASEKFDIPKSLADVIAIGPTPDDLSELAFDYVRRPLPEDLIKLILDIVTDPWYGLRSLALGTVIEAPKNAHIIELLPDLPGVAETESGKTSLVRIWLSLWDRYGFWLESMPLKFDGNEVRVNSGKFDAYLKRILPGKSVVKQFQNNWLPELLQVFTESKGNSYRLRGSEISLGVDVEWAYCQRCRTTQQATNGILRCFSCGSEDVHQVDPKLDEVFKARKGFYRKSTEQALAGSHSMFSLVAGEHTAQLNVAQSAEVFSKAERNELLFQDVDISEGDDQQSRALDVLSCTTTMEVGIDIGTLSGVALRNMPPARSNYQQRAGRAGRRGNSIATVIAFGSTDGHDEHYFSHPKEMISGKVIDPVLTLNNVDIVQRHVTAYLLQEYYRAKVPEVTTTGSPELFAVLGKVSDFLGDNTSINRKDFERWLVLNEDQLVTRINNWLPKELELAGRDQLLEKLASTIPALIDKAIGHVEHTGNDAAQDSDLDQEQSYDLEVFEEEGEEKKGKTRGSDNLLDRLLYKGILPKYAFPTDVAAFHIFDVEKSDYFPVFQFTPSQGLAAALSQYAPGKDVWVDNRLWKSGAIYTPVKEDRFIAWQDRKVYFECSFCDYSLTENFSEGAKGEKRDCPSCKRERSFGPGRYWFRPPGFAHPIDVEPTTKTGELTEISYATRAKLTSEKLIEEEEWTHLNSRLSTHYAREYLMVTNRGPGQDGYVYCTQCGRIEAYHQVNSALSGGHDKPYPDSRDQRCTGSRISRGIVLGTDFITDLLRIRVRVKDPVRLFPGDSSTTVALRTISEALNIVACRKLELEQRELQAEFRPALNEAGQRGGEVEIYMYDTLSGGAGFTRRVEDFGIGFFDETLSFLEKCQNENCDSSCYRCLKSYKNKLDHRLLDRELGYNLLAYLLAGKLVNLDDTRVEKAADVLSEDLHRNKKTSTNVQRNARVDFDGFGEVEVPIYVQDGDMDLVVAICNPLTPNTADSESIKDLLEYSPTTKVSLVDEMLIRKNLPEATRGILRLIDSGSE